MTEQEQEIYKLRSTLQVAANALALFKKDASVGDRPAQFYRASGALDLIKEQSGIVPNDAKVTDAKTMFAKDHDGGGMGYA